MTAERVHGLWPRRVLRLGQGVLLGVAASLLVLAAVDGRAGAQPATALPAPTYVEETATAGVDHTYDGDVHFFVGGGVAVFDCDGDGRPEVYLAGGSEPAALYRNDSDTGGALRFTPLPDPATDLTEVTGAYPLDIDGDGRTDLVVLRTGENVLLRGLGDCRFERANEDLGFDGGAAWTTAFSATWEPGSELPTLAFGNYLDPDDHERASCTDNVLVRPTDDGTAYATPTALAPGWCTLSVLFSDWDRSGRRDLRVSNDRHYYRDGQEQLWRVAPGSDAEQYRAEDGWQPLQIWGMGIASHDLTGDGYPEVFLTSQGDNKLQTLDGDSARPRYRDIAIERGVTAHRPHSGSDVRPSTSWHPEFQDVNNDGFVDLYIAKGNVDAMPEFADEDPSSLLIGQADGSFVEVAHAAGIQSFGRARGAAVVDLNLDGLLDVIEVNRGAPVRLWRNAGAGGAAGPAGMGNHASVRLLQAGPNRDAIGAWLEVTTGDRTTWRELTVGGGHAGGQLGWLHLGLGTADHASVRVHWPDGDVGPWLQVPAAGHVTIERGAAAARPWQLTP
jgi:enediyne biosynthesis protein E4